MIAQRFARAALITVATLNASSSNAHDAVSINNEGKVVVQNYSGYVNGNNKDCCSDYHCHPLDPSRYTVAPDGTVTITPIENSKLPDDRKKPNIVVSPSSKLLTTEPSTDGKLHECLSSGYGGGEFYCLLMPPGKTAAYARPAPITASFMPTMNGVRQRLTNFMTRATLPDGPICKGSR